MRKKDEKKRSTDLGKDMKSKQTNRRKGAEKYKWKREVCVGETTWKQWTSLRK